MKKRRYVRKSEIAIMRKRQNGLCSCGCGRSIDSGPVEIEHTLPLWLDAPDTLDNMTLMLAECHRKKTAAEAPVRAKVNRLHRRHVLGERPRARRGPPLRGGQKLRSRGFPKNSPWKRKLDGRTVRREKAFDS